jgi:dTMP kinase
VQQGRQPDLTLWFDVRPETAARRRAAARDADRLERESLAFFERVRDAYSARSAAAPQRFVRIDAELELPAVWQQVQQAVLERLAA